jgi:hypothetical protein
MMPLLSVIGIRTQGEITVIHREGGERDEAVPNRYSYSVGYEFALDDGTIICGNTKVIGNAYSAGISKVGAGPLSKGVSVHQRAGSRYGVFHWNNYSFGCGSIPYCLRDTRRYEGEAEREKPKEEAK